MNAQHLCRVLLSLAARGLTCASLAVAAVITKTRSALKASECGRSDGGGDNGGEGSKLKDQGHQECGPDAVAGRLGAISTARFSAVLRLFRSISAATFSRCCRRIVA